MEFLNPGLLGSMAAFRRRFSTAIEEGHDPRAAERLRRLVHPFILRRRKEEVARELPPKTEVILYCEMDRRQRTLYEELRGFYRRRVSEKIDAGGGEAIAPSRSSPPCCGCARPRCSPGWWRRATTAARPASSSS